MGLFDKFISKMASMGVNQSEVLTEELGENDAFIACGMVNPTAYEGSASSVGGGGTRLIAKAANAASNAISAKRHIGGEEGTVAASLTRQGGLFYGAVSQNAFSVWDFGEDGQQVPPALQYRIPSESIRSVAATGQKVQGGSPVYRFTFTDDSFFDFTVLARQDDFAAALDQRWSG